jgi:hypothetical protein
VTGEPDTYLPLDQVKPYVLNGWWPPVEDCAVRGVLVPPGMVVVNPDDIAQVVTALRAFSTLRWPVVDRLLAVLAASNPTTEEGA